MKTGLKFAAAVAALGLSSLTSAGVAVIANPSVMVNALTADQISRIFMGRSTSLPDGSAALPVDLAEGSPVRVQFAERVLGKSEQQLRNYWSRILFAGKGQPPRNVGSAAEVVKMVSSSPGFIGYVDTKDVVAGKVKVLYSIE